MDNDLKKGRGNPLTSAEKQRIDELYEKGDNQLTIAHTIGRNRKTVAKYLDSKGRRLEANVRERVLAEALKEHFKDLISQARQLKARFDPCSASNVSTLDVPMPELVLPAQPLLALPIPAHPLVVFNTWWRMYGQLDHPFDYLLESLREVHARDSRVWKLQAEWNRITNVYGVPTRRLWSWIAERVDEAGLLYQESITSDRFQRLLMGQALLMAEGHLGIPSNELVVHPSGTEGNSALMYRASILAIATRPAPLEKDREAFVDIQSQIQLLPLWVGLREGISKIRQGQPRLRDLYEQIQNEIDLLTLKRAFPGKCKLCPF